MHEFVISFSRQDLGWFFVYVIACILVLLLVAIRRKSRTWRKLGGKSWYPRKYIGETTFFPTYRGANALVWIDASEVDKPCYVAAGSAHTSEKGRHERFREKEERARERERERTQQAEERPLLKIAS